MAAISWSSRLNPSRSRRAGKAELSSVSTISRTIKREFDRELIGFGVDDVSSSGEKRRLPEVGIGLVHQHETYGGIVPIEFADQRERVDGCDGWADSDDFGVRADQLAAQRAQVGESFSILECPHPRTTREVRHHSEEVFVREGEHKRAHSGHCSGAVAGLGTVVTASSGSAAGRSGGVGS